MEKGGTPKKDEGISDILAAADRKTQQNGHAESSKNTQETGDSARNTHEDNKYGRETDLVNGSIIHTTDSKNLPVTDEVKLQSERDTTLSSGSDHRKPSNSQSDGDTINDNEVYEGQLDLSNPDSVIHMLENCDLTEEDTEDLLQEAYSMNRKLKEMLRRQDADQPASGKTKSQKPKPKNKPSQGSSATSSSSGSRVGSSFGSRKILPPIPGETSVYSMKLRRSQTQVPDRQMVHDVAPRSRSSKPPRKEMGSPTRRRKATEPKAEWNDRFNYS